MSTKKRVYIPKNKTNGQIKGKRKIWVENVKFLTLEEYDQLRETIKLHSRPELVKLKRSFGIIALPRLLIILMTWITKMKMITFFPENKKAIFRCMAFTRCCNEWLEKRKTIKSLLRLAHTLLEKLLVANSIRRGLTLKSFRSCSITPPNGIRATI